MIAPRRPEPPVPPQPKTRTPVTVHQTGQIAKIGMTGTSSQPPPFVVKPKP